MSKEINRYAVPPASMLIKYKDDPIVFAEQVQDGVERAALGDGAKTGAIEPASNKFVQQPGLEGTPQKMKSVPILRILTDPGNRCGFPIAKVASEDKSALAFGVSPHW